ncbi:MAG: GGDEF domain-containing protein [Gammaproteobacteria bacterium]|nr:GGDEF domain-containing protein [Gammaproteobacteria bacterium]MDH5735151.1 GGDEF domain-containing protein [Gammaproteobacteria bacterium]
MPVESKIPALKSLPPSCVLPLGLLLGIIFWLIDSLIDTFLFETGESFIHNLLSPEPVEYWMRALVIAMLIIFSLFVRRTLSREQKMISCLVKHKDELEEIVRQRTEQLEKLATTDDLTGILNRRKFYELLDQEIDRYKRYGTELSLLVIDIDYFKQVNDNFGHHSGDLLLQNFSAMVTNLIRKSDYFARIGGEEFAVILPEINLQQAIIIAEKIRNQISHYNFQIVGKLTASIGIGEIQANESSSHFYKRTDHALYIAKENGRNACHASIPGQRVDYIQKQSGKGL